MAKQTPLFSASQSAERRYTAQLKKIAKHSSELIMKHLEDEDGAITDTDEILRVAKYYSEAITPFARKTASQMLMSVANASARAWAANSIKIGNLAKEAIKSDAVAPTITALRARQVELIKSIPTEAAERVHSLALEQSIGGRRSEEIQEEIARTGEVTANRAKLIARTEVARSNSVINATRAKSIGATHYVWETMEDEAVRPSHEEMAGNIYAYDDPPEVEGEGNHGPGDFPNCRCFANPVLDNV